MAQPDHLETHYATASRMPLLTVLANLALAIIKGIAGVVGHSYALIADAMESVVDITGSFIVWGGLQYARKPADENHPYGHGKAEPLAAVVVAVSLVGAALGLAIQSGREIATPHHTPAPFTLGVLVAVLIVKELLYRVLTRTGRAVGSTALQSDAWHQRSDALTSLAAFVGISVALIGGKGWESADDWAALLVCGFIAFNGLRLLRKAVDEIMDVAPDPAIEQQVRETAGGVADVVAIETCMVRKMGLEYYVDLHVEVDGEKTVREGHDVAHRVKNAILAAMPAVRDVLVHIEPAENEADTQAG